ncbi:MAG: hypothetical protein HY826_08225 [Actinobacteria bacterium]|nr:hypothetical protein [Actinomycetota bacterium]
MRIVRSQMFLDSLKALQRTEPALFEVVAADLRYLLERRRDAQLPQVRFGIVQSAFPDVMGEVRSHIPGESAFVRTLFVMPDDETLCALLVTGDKNTVDGAQGNAWYDRAVPIADEIWRAIAAAEGQ